MSLAVIWLTRPLTKGVSKVVDNDSDISLTDMNMSFDLPSFSCAVYN